MSVPHPILVEVEFCETLSAAWCWFRPHVVVVREYEWKRWWRDWREVNQRICCQCLGIIDQIRWHMIDPKFLYKLGAFRVDGVPAFYPLHGRVLGVQDQSSCPCCPNFQLRVQIGCCVEWPVE